MNFNKKSVLSSGIPLPELYSVLSLEGIRTRDFKSGVLLYMCTPGFMHDPSNLCLKERAACVHAAGGYIVHDAGDALLAEWLEENVQLSDAISQAVQCAFKIWDVCKVLRSAHDSSRAVRIAISAGSFSKVRLGVESQVSVVIGPAVDEIQSAVALAEDGDIVLSPDAWQLCDRQNLTVEHIDNEGAVKVRHIRQQQSVSEQDLSLSNISILMKGFPRMGYLVTNVERGNIISKYMMQTALDKIHKNKHWQHLPEVWPASVMFLNLQLTQAQTGPSGSHHEVSQIISEQMLRCHGEIFSVFFFEEGCIFVCVVGLPGDKRQDKTDYALQAAYCIHEACLRQIDSLWSVSVGVATGRVSYKFKQSRLRKQFRVYGQAVYKAAKLTMDHPGIVSSDVTSKLYSMLPLSHVMPQGKISLHEDVCYPEEINQMLADEAAATSGGMSGMRLALAHMQTMGLAEQTVVNHASAIGPTFSIEMLKDILPYMNEQELLSSLKSLVTVGIIKFVSRPQNISSAKTCDSKYRRKCRQVSMDPFRQYGLMSFCNTDEMEMVYKLIQKNKCLVWLIHVKCSNYLEKKAYRCSKCKDKTFILEHKAATDDNSERLQEVYNAIRPYEVFQSQGVRCQNEIQYPTEGNGDETENFLAKVKSLLTETLYRTAAGSCECAQLVETVLFPRLRHWRCAGNVPMTFYYLLESAAACVYFQNDAKAMEYLTEARSIVENLKEGKLAFPSACPRYVQIYKHQQAFMHRLTGEILFKAGKILEAEENFRKVLKILNYKLPHKSVAHSFKLLHEKMKKLFYRFRQYKIPEKTKLGRLQECIDCLSFLWPIGCMRGQLRIALLAISMEINLAIQSGDPFKILYSTIDYLKYSQLKGEERECRRFEAFLCRTCGSLSDHPEGWRLISHLTQTLAFVKQCTGDLKQSIECTMQARQLSEVLNETGLDVRSTAALHLPLVLANRIWESVRQIQTLENLNKQMPSSVAEGWFYAACMNSLLYAGFAFRPFEECLAFVEESRSDANLEADKSLMLHLYSALALWYARLENWKKFASFFDRAYDAYAQIPTSVESISGVVMLLECSVLLYRNQQREMNFQISNTIKRTKKLISDLTQRFGTNHILTQRVLHLNAYLHHLTFSKTLEQDLLREALLRCEKQGNLLDQAWIRQSQADWSGACSDTTVEWSVAVLDMPSWDEALILQPEQLLKYCFRLKKKSRWDAGFPYIKKKSKKKSINP